MAEKKFKTLKFPFEKNIVMRSEEDHNDFFENYNSGSKMKSHEWLLGTEPRQDGKEFIAGEALSTIFKSNKKLIIEGEFKKFSNFVELISWNENKQNKVNNNTKLNLTRNFSYGDVTLLINTDYNVGNIENFLCRGEIINNLIILRTGFINKNLEIIMAVIFENVRLMKFMQIFEHVLLEIKSLRRTTINYYFTFEGTKKGGTVSKIDFESIEHTLK